MTARAPDDETDDDPADDAGGNFMCGYGGQPRCRVRLERRGLCEIHIAQLRAIVAKRPVPRETQEQENGRAAYDERRAQEAQKRTEAKAADIVAYIRAAKTFPVRRKDLAAALGNGAVLGRAMELVAERGEAIWYRASPKATGFYLPGEEPQRPGLTPEQRERQKVAMAEAPPTREEVEEAARMAGVVA